MRCGASPRRQLDGNGDMFRALSLVVELGLGTGRYLGRGAMSKQLEA